MRIAVVAVSLLLAGPVWAHHTSGRSAAPSPTSVGLLRSSTGTSGYVASTFEYVRLAATPPSYLDPLGEPAANGLAHELAVGLPVGERVTLELALPTFVALDTPSFHPGDLGAAARWLPWVRRASWLRVSARVTFPSGDPDRGLGAGAVVAIPTLDYVHHLAPDWTLSVTTALVASWRRNGDLALTHGGSLRWMFLGEIGAAVEATATTTLRESTRRAGLFARAPRDVGDTSVLLRPAVVARPTPALWIAAGPELVPTTVRDLDYGASLGIVYQLD